MRCGGNASGERAQCAEKRDVVPLVVPGTTLGGGMANLWAGVCTLGTGGERSWTTGSGTGGRGSGTRGGSVGTGGRGGGGVVRGSGTLGDSAGGNAGCGAGCGGGATRGSGTLGDSVGAGGRRGGVGVGLSAGTRGMDAEKRSESVRRALVYSVPKIRNGEAGAGCRSALASILAASAALSLDNVAGMAMSCGKKATVRAMRSARFLVI